MGLDKKPTPPPKRIREDREPHSPEDAAQHTPEMDKESESTAKEDAAAHSEPELSQPQEVESKIEEDIPPEEEKPRDGDWHGGFNFTMLYKSRFNCI